LIAPSILNSDFLRLGEQIEMLNSSEADLIHLDIMDGNFVPNLTFGFPVIRQIKSVSKLPLDTHLMIRDPDKYLEDFREAGADNLTVHYEVCDHLHRTVQRIKDLGMTASVSLNPATPVHILEDILSELHMVLIMTVNPGFGGQEMIPSCVEKVRQLDAVRRERGLSFCIAVDGGINERTAATVRDAGADVLVSGSAFFKSKQPAAMLAAMRGTAVA
ncbi:MAG: ribulose-phosphate 3-epimerase, partial [Spirochaetales bacterium]